jgi:IS30 family transposase
MRGIMSTYTQLTQEERYQIHALMKAGYSQTEIASMLGRDKSTISRELKRNQDSEDIGLSKPRNWPAGAARQRIMPESARHTGIE